jgi:uncharacterized membrane protein
VTTLTVWKFGSPRGADEAEYTLTQLQAKNLITLHDAALVSWEYGADKPQTRQLHGKGRAAKRGSLWGLLFGTLFAVPVIGMAAGAAAGVAAHKLRDAGIDDEFITAVRDNVTPGTSALFLMTSGAVMDEVRAAFDRQHMQLISTNLSKEQEEALHQALSD